MPDILSVFQQKVAISAADSEAKFGESVDELLGFSSMHEEQRPEIDLPYTAPDSWQNNLANYRSIAEYRLQTMSQSALAFARTTFRDAAVPDGDSVCVRIVDKEYGSPYTLSVDSYHYVLIPSGFIKSLENIWRVHFSLAANGKKLDGVDSHVGSNRIGGALVERALTADFRNSWQVMDSIFADAGWHRWFEGSLSFPESVLTAGAKIAHEVMHGMYSTEGKPDSQFRLEATGESRWLTRLVLAYILAHEMAHVIFNAEAPDRTESNIDEETLCDLFATSYYPNFIEYDARGWAVGRDGGTEYLAGMFGFFTAVQIRDTAGLILGVQSKEILEGDNRYLDISHRMAVFERRAMDQFGVLSRVAVQARVDQSFAVGVLSEFQALLVGVQMVGVRFLLRRNSSFAAHFDKWNDELVAHLEEMESRRQVDRKRR